MASSALDKILSVAHESLLRPTVVKESCSANNLNLNDSKRRK